MYSVRIDVVVVVATASQACAPGRPLRKSACMTAVCSFSLLLILFLSFLPWDSIRPELISNSVHIYSSSSVFVVESEI
jgi:hypothetical protein